MKHLDFFKRCGSARLWCLLALVALTANVAKADLILHENFDRTVGTLNKGTSQDNMGTNTTDWWCFSGTTDYISVVENSLSYDGYVTAATGNKAELKGNGADDLRQFSPITSGKVYAAAIINVDSLKPSTGTDYFFTLGDAGTGMWARLYARSVKNGDAFTGYQLGVTKYTETAPSTCGWAEQTLLPKTNYLVVLEYEFVSGEKNDTARLYINPIKTTTKAGAECIQEAWNSDNTRNNGASGKDDATKIASVNLRKTSTTPGRVYVDEIKVATSWNDLFEGGDTPEPTPTATITAPSTLTFTAPIFVGETYTSKFTVSGSNLTADITLASNNDEVVLSHTTIAQADAAAEGGVEVTATLNAATAGTQTATITLSSEGATDVTITASWQAIALNKVATIAALKAGVTTDPEKLFLYTGEAVITYYEVTGEYSTPTFYVEDATGAVRIYDYYENTCKVGDKIKDFRVVASEEETYRGLPFTFLSTVTIVSSGNDWTPQVVTLKELQDNHDDYLLELVKVEDVTLDLTETTYKAGNNTISQDGTDGAISLTSDNTLVGTAKPAKADVVGISYFTSGYNIRVRMAADIVAKSSPTTGLCRPAEAGQPPCYTTNGQLYIEGATGEVAIYNLTGICVAKTTVAEQATIALPQGVYAVKVAGSTHKIVVK